MCSRVWFEQAVAEQGDPAHSAKAHMAPQKPALGISSPYTSRYAKLPDGFLN